MPLQLAALSLTADAPSVGQARAWVRDIIERLDRHELVAAAESGVSELVTNAVLHAGEPITVRVRGTHAHPRVEVQDGSRRPPAMRFDISDEDQLLSTFGRGLGLVAMLSSAWGADLLPDGKVVWFMPAQEARTDGDLSGEVFDLEELVRDQIDANAGRPVEVCMIDLPVAAWARFRQRYFDLARECRILGVAAGEDYQAARRFSEVFLEAERQGRLIRGRAALDDLAGGSAGPDDTATVQMLVPATMPEVTNRLIDTLREVDELCRQEHMLALAAPPAEQQLVTWWFTEIARQVGGQEPLSWPDYLALQGEQPSGPGE